MIHPTAVVEPGADIGRDVAIGPFAYVQAGARVGDGCVIGPHASILRFTSVGSGCRIHAGAVLGDLPQDLSFKETESFVRIGSGCVVREGVTIHRGTKPGTATEVGDGCYLMAFSHLAHNVKLGANVIMANGALLGGYVEVGDRVFISGHCGVHQFVRIGRVAMLGGASAVSKDVPPFCTTRPMTLNKMLSVNVVGMRRAGIATADREAIRQAFRLLYHSGLNVSQALAAIRESVSSGPALELCEFVAQSKRGICGAQRAEGSEEDA
jgi:UDP-N-acetylglucosamine acyltransferase